MPVMKLETHRVAKPWGRHRLMAGFPDPAPAEDPIGEVWFQEQGDAAPDLLIKYLFTSERLSVQVHPDDEQAQARGLPRGKDECWVILAAEPDSTIALGLKQAVDRETLREAAKNGSIEGLLDWKSVRAGDFFYSASGTIHAIGAGITLIEVQQNSETTYRLYDYGRPRELHLEQGVAVSDPVPYEPIPASRSIDGGREILVEGPKFVLERWSRGREVALPAGMTGWLVPVSGSGRAGSVGFSAGECLTMTGTESVVAENGVDLLFAYPGSEVMV